MYWSLRPLRSISSYLVRMRENTDQKKSKYGHFSRSGHVMAFFKKRFYLSKGLKIYCFSSDSKELR